ncbi:MAG: hypothetical protein JWM03_169, partial [Rhodocyclales bacterium]|nr:hypothetical protein [Rhodocyclales bacterium]
MSLDPRIDEITSRIRSRSAERRARYLSRLDAAI